MTSTKKFDVFLSHHSSDKKWVINLKDALEAHDLSVWLDKDEIRPGDLFAKSLEDGLRSCRNIVFVVTKKSMKSKWVEEEYYRALSLSKSKKQPARLIPIVLQSAKLPGFLESRNWIDFRDEIEFDENVKRLVWGITGQSKYQEVEQRYIELALRSYDIIDLGNLPDQDFRIATQRLELRNLYVSLHVKPEIDIDAETREMELDAIESRRKISRSDKGIFGEREEFYNKQVDYEPILIGPRLGKVKRLVVLGDPGAGKTTLIKWIATAYLLRLKKDPDWEKLPEAETLPQEDWLPVVIRCRDISPECFDGSLDNILTHILRKLELAEAECKILLKTINEKLHKGRILLLIDGLDEILESNRRSSFCKQIERIHNANVDIPIIVTSRIVGYKEMGDRILRGFEHVTVAELSNEDKESFAYRWIDVTESSESPDRRENEAKALMNSINSNFRLQRLTSNPMMLTTLALVKRKVGKLPSRRARLYSEAVQVLLNWRHEVDIPVDDHEALPQLEYLAYSMCDRGVQKLREDEIIEVFEEMRKEYSNIHSLHQHSSIEFLRLLVRRTGILVKTGFESHHGQEIPVYEFKHLTFQEYLAGLSLVKCHFPGYQPSKSLAEHVAPLASRITLREDDESREQDRWREALRLCVASCNDNDVDTLLLAILNVQTGEDTQLMARLRAVEATLCLADDINASPETARKVLEVFARKVDKGDGDGYIKTDVDATAVEMVKAKSHWMELMRSILIDEFCNRDMETRQAVGGLCGMVIAKEIPSDEVDIIRWHEDLAIQILGNEKKVAIGAVLGTMQLAYEKKVYIVPGLVEGLLSMLEVSDPASQHASAWALAC